MVQELSTNCISLQSSEEWITLSVQLQFHLPSSSDQCCTRRCAETKEWLVLQAVRQTDMRHLLTYRSISRKINVWHRCLIVFGVTSCPSRKWHGLPLMVQDDQVYSDIPSLGTDVDGIASRRHVTAATDGLVAWLLATPYLIRGLHLHFFDVDLPLSAPDVPASAAVWDAAWDSSCLSWNASWLLHSLHLAIILSSGGTKCFLTKLHFKDIVRPND